MLSISRHQDAGMSSHLVVSHQWETSLHVFLQVRTKSQPLKLQYTQQSILWAQGKASSLTVKCNCTCWLCSKIVLDLCLIKDEKWFHGAPAEALPGATYLESSEVKTPASLAGTGNSWGEVRHVAAHMTWFPPQTSWQKGAKKKEHVYFNKWQLSLSRDKSLVINLLSLIVTYFHCAHFECYKILYCHFLKEIFECTGKQ